MKNLKCILLMLIVALVGSFQAHAQPRSRVSFNSNWKFKLDSVHTYQDVSYNDTNWRVLQVPHDWSIEGSFDEKHPATPGGGALPGGIGWYRKSFKLPAEDKGKQFRIVLMACIATAKYGSMESIWVCVPMVISLLIMTLLLTCIMAIRIM